MDLGNRQERSIEAIDRMIAIIEQEIINAGEKIDPKKLGHLTKQVQDLLDQKAKMTSEPINKKVPWRGDAE